MSPIAGFTRFRSHQVGKQSAILTPVPATRVLPYRGPIVVNPNRTDPDVDTGSIDPVMAPFTGAKSVTATWAGKQAYNDLPYILAMAGKGGVTPASSGTARTWTFTYASLTADSFEYMTDEWGDDTNATDGIRAYGGVIDSYTLGFGNDLSPFDLSTNNVYSDADFATARTGALSVDTSPTWVYGADTIVYIDPIVGNIGTTPLVDAVHALSWNWQNNLDLKRFANGSNTRFKLAGYGRGQRVIELTLTVAKTAATIAERATLDDDPTPDRFIRVATVSSVTASAGIPYSWTRDVPVNLISATDGEIGGNTTITFVYRAKYNATLTFACKDIVATTLSAL